MEAKTGLQAVTTVTERAVIIKKTFRTQMTLYAGTARTEDMVL